VDPNILHLRNLKEGGATRLSLVKDVAVDKYFVEKFLVVNIAFQKRLFENEIQVHSALHHRHIIKFVRRTAENSFLMEYAAKGNFSLLLNVQSRPGEVLKALGDFLKGLTYLHEKGYVHNDIKPSNILLTEDRSKLADFAFSGKIGQVTFDEIPHYSMVGTDIYAPKKRGTNQVNSIQDDLYACGIILFQIFSRLASPEKIDLRKVEDLQAREIIQQCLLGEFDSVETLRSRLLAATSEKRLSDGPFSDRLGEYYEM
jgi:protein kinase